jgi:DNA-binding response OmpR family regulator
MLVLVIEDEDAIREVEIAYLNKEGYETRECSSGSLGIASFRREEPDLVIIDLNLPGMDGLEVCRIIRSLSVTPILMVTARNSDDDEVKGLEMGADDYIKKPFNPNVLIARVNALLRKRQNQRLVFEEIIVDPKTMTVIKDGKDIVLTTTRFNLLLALASQPNVVFSRNQLVDQIYSDPSSHLVYDRTIDAHIKALRKQIEADPANPRLIETVIGSGYRFRSGTVK